MLSLVSILIYFVFTIINFANLYFLIIKISVPRPKQWKCPPIFVPLLLFKQGGKKHLPLPCPHFKERGRTLWLWCHMKMSYMKLTSIFKKSGPFELSLSVVLSVAHLQRLDYNAAAEALHFNIPPQILTPSVVIKTRPSNTDCIEINS